MATSFSQSDSINLSTSIEPSSQNQPGFVVEELAPDKPGKGAWEDYPRYTVPMHTGATRFLIPDLYTAYPPIRDILETHSSYVQDETIYEILPFLNGTSDKFTAYNQNGIPHLDRARHIRFLHKLLQGFPSNYVAADSSRPWFFYWTLCSLRTLGEDVSGYRERLVNTVRPLQNVTGGFGGGHGQMSHLAPTYAVLLALSMVGGEEALEIVDRKTMWHWLGAIKQPDGGFQMCLGAEEDIRGAYCAATVISLLNLPLELPSESPARLSGVETLLSGLAEYVSRCQTYEGGVSARPNNEAHGAYAFCALACLCILGEPHIIIPKYLNVPALISWLSSRQCGPEGGFSGRTNKLVDGCYSLWVGGCWPLINAVLEHASVSQSARKTSRMREPTPRLHVKEKGEFLYDKEGLVRYILCVCQDTSRRGGMRDKPSKTSDGYHTCYVLTGLSSAQHNWSYTPKATPTENSTNVKQTEGLPSAFNWTRDRVPRLASLDKKEVFDEEDRVGTIHPIFVVPEGVAEKTRSYFSQKGGFT